MSQFLTCEEVQTLFDNCTTESEYDAAKRLCRHLRSADVLALVDSMIDARLRLELDRIAREGL